MGESAVLVVRGEPGVGKTALLGYAAERAEGCRVVRALGVEAEMELPFAGLQQLCAPLLDGLDRLPPPQRAVLDTAFGMTVGAPPDRFLVGLAVLNLLSDAAEGQPLVCLVDDAQWLDRSSAQVLAFVARRLQAESVVLLFAEREPAERHELAGLPDLQVTGISHTYATDLLASAISGPLDDRVRDQLLAEARGNPLALLELPRDLSPAKRAGGFGLPDAQPVRGLLETTFRRRVQRLPAATQRLLLVAAAEPTGDLTLLWRAATELGISAEAIGSAEADGVVELGSRVAFRHPLLRSAIYRAAPVDERRRVHRALAEVTDADSDPDRRAWHLAHATIGPDEDVAGELERSAGRAQSRGGLAAAAAFLERASTLTLESTRRARRALKAAGAELLAGAPETALALLATAADGPLDERERGELQRLQGQIALDLRRGNEAVPLLLDAAERLQSLDLGLARETYLEALRAASVGGRLGGGRVTVAEAVRAAPPPAGAPRPVDLLLDGLAVRFTEGYAASVSTLRHALRAVRDEDGHPGQDVRWPGFARRVAPDLFDDEMWRAFAVRNVEIARETGALAVLPLALHYLAQLHIFEGELDAADTLLDEADVITEATSTTPLAIATVLLAACRGDEAPASAIIDASEADALARGEGVSITFAEHARSVLYNGLGHYDAALASAQSASARDELMVSVWSLPEVVEAATRSDRTAIATEALERLTEQTRAAGTELALGIEAGARAFLSEGEAAERLHLEAIERLGRTRIRFNLARAHLRYGEWLRREGRRVVAREQLRTAHDMLASMGIEAFAERARRELSATGVTVRKRTVETRDELIAQEAQIARLAAEGRTNPEIGEALFISARTVEWHLRKVYPKLGITSRRELRRTLPQRRAASGSQSAQ